MKDQLKAAFTDAQREAAASIGEDLQLSVAERVEQLFLSLGDPQLAAEDVGALLGGTSTQPDVQGALDKLVSDGQLDESNDTQRPLDANDIVLYRRADVPFARLKLIALEASLGGDESRFQLTCDGRLIRSLARVDRLDALAGTGAQRAEIQKHVNAIAEGIRGGDQIPNAILLVIDTEFTSYDPDPADEVPESWIAIRPLQDEWIEIRNPVDSLRPSQLVRLVEFDIPFRSAAFDGEKTCLLVDGQQRTAALSLVPIDEVPTYSLSVNAVIATDDEARRIFQIANSTVKIATDFGRALTAAMHEVPGYMKGDKRRANATRLLALQDVDSPFYGIVRYPGVKTTPEQVLVHNSLYQVVSTFDQRLDLATEELLAAAVKRGYLAVKSTWPSAWGTKVAESKLMHGAGLRGIADLLVFQLQKAVAEGRDLDDEEVWVELRASLGRLTPIVQWTEADVATGTKTAKDNWSKMPVLIKERQNTSKDIGAISTFLVKQSIEADAQAKKATEPK